MNKKNLKNRLIPAYTIVLVLGLSLDAGASLINGDFETGDLTGWNQLSTDWTLDQEVISTPIEFTPPLSGFSYKIRPGTQVIDAGIGQSINTIAGYSYNWSIDIAAREIQAAGFALGTFELRLDGTTVASQTLAGSDPFSTTFSGVYTATDSAVDFQLIFNRPLHGFTAHPQWFADNATFEVSSVPLPAAVWLFGSGLLGLFGAARRS